MRKIPLLLIAMLLLSVTLISCDDGPGGSQDESHLILYTEFQGLALEFLREQTEAFSEQNPGVTIEILSAESQVFDTFFKTAVAGGEQIDVVQVNIQFFRDYVQSGFLQPISPYVDFERAPKIDMAWQQESYFSMSDEVFGMPTSLDSSAIYYNRAVFEEFGLDIPVTWDDVFAIRDALEGTDVSALVYAGAEPWWNPMHFNIMFYQITGNRGLEINDRFMSGDFSPEIIQYYVDTLQFFADLHSEGVFISGTQGMDLPSAIGVLTSGRAAMFYMGTWFRMNLAESAPDFDYGVFPVPTMGSGLQSQPAGSIAVMFCIYVDALHPEIAGEFITFYASPEVQQQGFDQEAFVGLSITPGAAPISTPVNDEFGRIAPSTVIWLDAIWEPEIITAFQQGCQSVILGERTAQQVMDDIVTLYQQLREQGRTFFD